VGPRSLLSLALLVCAPALAGPFGSGNWISRGPTNISGLTTALLVDPADERVMLAATSGGVWSSDDAGASWSLLPRFDAVNIRALARHPQKPDELWAGGPAVGVFRSLDRGKSWSFIEGTEVWAVYSIAVAADSKVFVATIGALRMTSDGGAIWRTFPEQGLFNPSVLFHPTDPMRAVAVLGRNTPNGLRPTPFVTADGGLTWQQAAGIDISGVRGLAVAYAPSQPSTLYAFGTPAPYVRPGTIWRSDDHGRTFTVAGTNDNIGDGQRIIAVHVSPVNPNHLITGAFHSHRSTDGGATSTPLYELKGHRHIPHEDVLGLTMLDGKRALLWGDGGVYRTDDVFAAKPQWQHLSQSMVNTQVYAFDVGRTGAVVVAMQDTGANVMPTGSGAADYKSDGDQARVAFDPLDEPVFYSQWTPGLVYRSSYTSWPFVDVRNGQAPLWSDFQIDPNDPRRMFVGAATLARIDGIQDIQPRVTTIRAADPNPVIAVASIAVQPGDSNVVWMATSLYLYRTRNALADSPAWEQMMRIPFSADLPLKVVVDDANTVYFLGRRALLVTRDGGASWQTLTLPWKDHNTDFVRHPSVRQWLYVSTERGLYGSADGGVSWTAAAPPMLAKRSVTAVRFAPGTNTLWASTYGQGMWSVEVPPPPPRRRAARP
jgi:photosystem II stability/assembly factor-like uncharacterized protein